MKIFVDVHTPGNGKTYEFQIDSMMTVGQAKGKMIEEILEIENRNITLDLDKAVLCNKNTRLHLNELVTLKTAGVKSGQSLILL